MIASQAKNNVIDSMIYTRQCSVKVSAHDLAVMGSTLANHGVTPVTKKKVIDPQYPQHVLASMATAGLYDGAGNWLYNTGTPAKSGVGGGIVAVIPGKLAIGVFAPPLDSIGNSVKGQLGEKEKSLKVSYQYLA